MAEEAGASVSETATETPAETASETPRMFSQDELDRIVRDRVARAKATPPADYEELKQAASKLAQLEESQKSELEKAQARADAADKEREKVLAESRQIRLRSAILAEAAKPERRIVDPDLVATLLGPELELDDQGNPTNVAKAMDSLLEARPYLVVPDGGSRGSADQGARAGGAKQLTAADAARMTPEEVQKAVDDGRFATALGTH